MAKSKAAPRTKRGQNWLQRHWAAVSKLPGDLRAAGQALLGCDARGQPRAARAQSIEAGVRQVDEMPVQERYRVFEALFPKIAPHVEAAWLLTRQLPYQSTCERKPFCAPHAPAVSRRSRAAWFASLLAELGDNQEDIAGLAAQASQRAGAVGADALPILLAAAVNAGDKDGDDVFQILGRAGQGRHAIRALLIASRPDGWDLVEKMLLAVDCPDERREAVLETMDEAHPEAFRRLLRLVLDHGLARLGTTVRVMDAWFGFQWESVSVRVVNRVLERVLRYLEDPEAQEQALAGEDAETAYLALWTLACDDAAAAVQTAAPLLSATNVERRFVAVHLLGQLDLPEARRQLLAALEDEDLRVVLRALEDCRAEVADTEEIGAEPGLFERIETVLLRMPVRKKHLEPIVWPWQVLTADRANVSADLVSFLGPRPATRLIPFLSMMNGSTQARAVAQLAALKKWDRLTRETLFALVGDSNRAARESAQQALAACTPTKEESLWLEELLTRKTGEVRQGALALLLNQKEKPVLASADRLLSAADRAQRIAGLELLRRLSAGRRARKECRTRAADYRKRRSRLVADERRHVDAILNGEPSA